MPVRVTLASAPPASMASARPLRMCSVASPSAWLPDAQAVEVHVRGPFRPNAMDTWAAAMLAMTQGMNRGEARSGPRCSTTSVCETKLASPPIPLPIAAPTRGPISSDTASEASSSASRPAATASWAKRSILRADRRSMKSVGSNPLTSQAITVAVSSGS